MTNSYHIPALLAQSVEGLNLKPEGGVYVDATFGAGGHAREILKQLNENGKLFGFDQDIDAYENRIDDERFTFVLSNFEYLKRFLKYFEVEKIDGILADLGVSFHHFDSENRGFSFRFENGELDMRMNTQASLKAADVLNTYSEEKLADVLYFYGEMHNARAVAKAIVKARENEKFKTAAQFSELLKKFLKHEQQKKGLAQAYQALRIEVNNELAVLRKFLTQAAEILSEGGRLAVITYHSLEDRLVKNFMKTGNFEGKQEKDFYGNLICPFKMINNKVITPDEDEIERNPRSRSAKLRVAEKK